MIKKYTLTLVLFGSVLIAAAQSFTLTPKNPTINKPSGAFDVKGTSVIENISGDSSFTWKKISENQPSAWTGQLCDPAVCYVSIPDSATFYLAPGKIAEIYLLFASNGADGNADMTVEVYKTLDPSDKDTIKFSLSIGANGIAATKASALSFSPNPVTNGTFTMNTGFTGEYAVKMINISGQEVFQGTASDTAPVQLPELANGTYIVIASQNGTTVQGKCNIAR